MARRKSIVAATLTQEVNDKKQLVSIAFYPIEMIRGEPFEE